MLLIVLTCLRILCGGDSTLGVLYYLIYYISLLLSLFLGVLTDSLLLLRGRVPRMVFLILEVVRLMSEFDLVWR